MNFNSVLFACDSWYGSTAYGLAQGFRKLGWDIYDVNTVRYFPDYSSTSLRIIKRIIKPLAVKEYNNRILEQIDLLKPDLFLTVKGAFLLKETLIEIKNRGILSINYYPDYHFSYRGVVDQTTFPYYTHFFTTKSFQLDYLYKILGKDKTSYLPHGYVPEVHSFRENNINSYNSDLLYIGTHDKHKEKWLSQVKRNFPQIKFLIYGPGWLQNTTSHSLKESVIGQGIYGLAYSYAIQTSKINLAIHMGSVDNTGWQDLVSTRTFEIPACKGFMLHIDNPEVRELFEPDKEIGVFSDIDTLSDRIQHYLTDENHRLDCIANAYKRCVPAYSYDNRAKVISEWYHKIISNNE